MKVVLVSEVYPPRAGGAGWSCRALALGLRDAGHQVEIVTTSPGPPDLDGFPVRRLKVSGRKRLAVPRAFAAQLDGLGSDDDDGDEGAVIHAQHSLAALGAARGARARRVAVTVRDHWPVCFWSTLISGAALCPGCSLKAMTRCVGDHVAYPAPFRWGVVAYMKGDLVAKQAALRRAGAVLAVSEAIASELRAAGVPRVETLPNMVDADEVREAARGTPSMPLPERFLLFVGKLEDNKGARLLVPAVAAARTGLPLVVLGEGSLAHSIKFEAAARGVELILRGWADRLDVLRAMARTRALVFPSLWPEPLSRVLLEALVLGTPVAAMDTGGTAEILAEGSGLVVPDVGALGEAVARLVSDAALRRRLADASRERAAAFAPAMLIPRYEAVYRRLA